MIRKNSLVFVILALACFAAEPNGAIKTDLGFVSGSLLDGVTSYKGIPFAAPPVGDLRWKAPQAAKGWDGVRDGSAFGPQCMQQPYPEGSVFRTPPAAQSEDCLYLNVWTAAKAGAKRPVMVWIHGGALTRGSGATRVYDGAALAKKGVVLVTVNYRLGVFGYLAHPELTAESPNKSSGNYGVLDQIAALKWVQRNIDRFGGDPGRVTIFGESAGSWSVNALVASPLAKGLFHRAIGQSGGSFGAMTKLADAEKAGAAFAKSAGADSLAAMRALGADKVLASADTGFRTAPNVDGWLLPDEIRNIFAQGKHNDVPVIVGSNANEMTSLTSPSAVPKTLEDYRKRITPLYGEKVAEFDALYPAKTGAEVGDAWLGAVRDVTFTLPMRSWARATANGRSKAWLYWFSHVPPNPNSAYLKAYHAAEIAYVFNNVSQRPQSQKADFDLADTMSNYWVNFAATGDPNGKGLPAWSPYDRESEHYMEFSSTPVQKQHLLKDQLDFQEKTGMIRRR